MATYQNEAKHGDGLVDCVARGDGVRKLLSAERNAKIWTCWHAGSWVFRERRGRRGEEVRREREEEREGREKGWRCSEVGGVVGGRKWW